MLFTVILNSSDRRAGSGCTPALLFWQQQEDLFR